MGRNFSESQQIIPRDLALGELLAQVARLEEHRGEDDLSGSDTSFLRRLAQRLVIDQVGTELVNADLQVHYVISAEATRPLVIVGCSVFCIDQVSSQMTVLRVSLVGPLKAIQGHLTEPRAAWLLLLLRHIYCEINESLIVNCYPDQPQILLRMIRTKICANQSEVAIRRLLI